MTWQWLLPASANNFTFFHLHCRLSVFWIFLDICGISLLPLFGEHRWCSQMDIITHSKINWMSSFKNKYNMYRTLQISSRWINKLGVTICLGTFHFFSYLGTVLESIYVYVSYICWSRDSCKGGEQWWQFAKPVWSRLEQRTWRTGIEVYEFPVLILMFWGKKMAIKQVSKPPFWERLSLLRCYQTYGLFDNM